jgi:hypothetical protein
MAARRALLQTSKTVRGDGPRARAAWGAVRQSPEVSKALASQSWATVIRAIRENDARLVDANAELERRKSILSELDAQLAQLQGAS